MIYVGIDVAKDKHDCCILGSDGEILFSSLPFRTLFRDLIRSMRRSGL